MNEENGAGGRLSNGNRSYICSAERRETRKKERKKRLQHFHLYFGKRMTKEKKCFFDSLLAWWCAQICLQMEGIANANEREGTEKKKKEEETPKNRETSHVFLLPTHCHHWAVFCFFLKRVSNIISPHAEISRASLSYLFIYLWWFWLFYSLHKIYGAIEKTLGNPRNNFCPYQSCACICFHLSRDFLIYSIMQSGSGLCNCLLC